MDTTFAEKERKPSSLAHIVEHAFVGAIEASGTFEAKCQSFGLSGCQWLYRTQKDVMINIQRAATCVMQSRPIEL